MVTLEEKVGLLSAPQTWLMWAVASFSEVVTWPDMASEVHFLPGFLKEMSIFTGLRLHMTWEALHNGYDSKKDGCR